VGLLCAAIGIDREKDDLMLSIAALRMGVRADREGLMKYDYHTAGKGGYLQAKGDVEKKTLIESWRYYLADAAFLVGLYGENNDYLKQLHDALLRPAWPLFLGRKAFVPSEPVWLKDGLKDEPLETALENYHPRLREPHDTSDDRRVRLVLEDPARGMLVRRDQPRSFAKGRRDHDLRRLSVTFIDLKENSYVPVTAET
jgi:CRISPR system Cascade subunit CasD